MEFPLRVWYLPFWNISVFIEDIPKNIMVPYPEQCYRT